MQLREFLMKAALDNTVSPRGLLVWKQLSLTAGRERDRVKEEEIKRGEMCGAGIVLREKNKQRGNERYLPLTVGASLH